MEFDEFLRDRYRDWKGPAITQQDKSIVQFAAYIHPDLSHQLLRGWMGLEEGKKPKKPKHKKYIDALVDRFGYEVYGYLDIEPPTDDPMAWPNLTPLQKIMAQYMQDAPIEEQRAMIEDARRRAEQRHAENAQKEESQAKPNTGPA